MASKIFDHLKDYEDEPPANTACAILEAKEKENITGVDNVLDLIRNLFPSSIPKALTTQMKTELIYSGPDLNGTVLQIYIQHHDDFYPTSKYA